MRVSTLTIFEQSVSLINRQHAAFHHVGIQIASGRRVVSPSDDPQAASRALQVLQSQAVTDQYTDARVSARNALLQEESVLGRIADAITAAKTLVVQAANGTLNDADRDSIAGQLRGIYETVIGQANATDGNGRYLFGGYQDDSEPFIPSTTGGQISYIYVGDDNQRDLRIDASRLMPVTDNGRDIFLSVHESAGYLAEAGPNNTGSITFEGPKVIDAQNPDYGSAFVIEFVDNGNGIEFSVSRDGVPMTGMTDVPYESGKPIQFGGLTMTFEGEPNAGDEIVVDVASKRDPNLFGTFEKLLQVLETPAETPPERAALINTVNTAMREFDNSLDNVLTIRASVGARLNELDIIDAIAESRELNYQQTLSDLVDLDYVDAISEYTLRQIGLSAAQKAFVQMKGMSLFNYL